MPSDARAMRARRAVLLRTAHNRRPARGDHSERENHASRNVLHQLPRSSAGSAAGVPGWLRWGFVPAHDTGRAGTDGLELEPRAAEGAVVDTVLRGPGRWPEVHGVGAVGMVSVNSASRANDRGASECPARREAEGFEDCAEPLALALPSSDRYVAGRRIVGGDERAPGGEGHERRGGRLTAIDPTVSSLTLRSRRHSRCRECLTSSDHLLLHFLRLLEVPNHMRASVANPTEQYFEAAWSIRSTSTGRRPSSRGDRRR